MAVPKTQKALQLVWTQACAKQKEKETSLHNKFLKLLLESLEKEFVENPWLQIQTSSISLYSVLTEGATGCATAHSMDESSTTEEEQVAATGMSLSLPDESFSERGKHKTCYRYTGRQDSPKDAPEDNTDNKKVKVNSSESEEL